mgnify:CR=1 FL=1
MRLLYQRCPQANLYAHAKNSMNLSGKKVTMMKMTRRSTKKRAVMFWSSQKTKLRTFSKKSEMTSIHWREKLAPFFDSLY